MANYYTNFSFQVGLRNEKEKAWCSSRLSFLANHSGEMYTEEDCQTEEEKAIFKEVGNLFEDSYLDFDWEIDPVDPVDPKTKLVAVLWIKTEETGSPDNVALFLQEFLKRFRRKDGVWFSFAHICDKLRLNAFDGGACSVTSTDIKFFNPSIDAQNFLKKKGFKPRKQKKGGDPDNEGNVWRKR